MEDRVNDEYGSDFLDSGGLLPDDTYTYKVCLFGHYQSDKYDHSVIEDYALTCEKKDGITKSNYTRNCIKPSH